MDGWIKHVSDSIYLALCAVFGLNPESPDALKRFVPAYIENATNTQAPRTMNVCYYAISEDQNTAFDYVQIRNAAKLVGSNYQIVATVPVNVLFTFYGVNADDDAEVFWQRIQQDIDCTSARALLRGRRIVPNGQPSRPLAVFEVEGTFHRRRCDVRMSFAYLMITEASAGYVDTPPAVNISNQ